MGCGYVRRRNPNGCQRADGCRGEGAARKTGRTAASNPADRNLGARGSCATRFCLTPPPTSRGSVTFAVL